MLGNDTEHGARRGFLAATGAAATAALAGCSSGADTDTTTTQTTSKTTTQTTTAAGASAGGTLQLTASSFDTLDPANVTTDHTTDHTTDNGRRVGTYGPVRNGETLDSQGIAGLSVDSLVFNTDRVPEAARKATAYAMNQQSLVDDVFKGRGLPTCHMTPPNIDPGGPQAQETHAKEYTPTATRRRTSRPRHR